MANVDAVFVCFDSVASSFCASAVLVLRLSAAYFAAETTKTHAHKYIYIYRYIACMLDILPRQVRVGGKLEGSCAAY